MRQPEHYTIRIDLDRDRIRDILRESYKIAKDILNVEFNIDEDTFTAKIEPFLSSNRTTLPVQIHLPSRQYPELIVEVNLRSKSVFARFRDRELQAELNHAIKAL